MIALKQFGWGFGWGFGAFIIGVFALSNIFLPLFYTLPRLRKEKQAGNLVRKVPFLKLLWAPIINTAVILFGLYYAHGNCTDYLTQIYVGLGIAAFGLISRIGGQNADMEEDFTRSYKEYLRETNSH